MATGRTVGKYVKFQIEDSGGVLRDIPVSALGSVGLTYDEVDVSAIQEAVKNFFSGQANFSLSISGPFDNRAAQAASTSGQAAASHLSGSHTVLEPLNGGLTPRAMGIYIGIQADWSTGDPVFGADNCVIVTDYTVDPAAGTYSAKIAHVSGGTVPDWGTTAITVA
jgi:hypothetical protein